MKIMTAQEIFDKVATHLFTQGHPAMKGENCLYLAPNGDKCAVGCLIEPDEYQDRFENNDVTTIIKMGALSEIAAHVHLLSELQVVHDNENAVYNEETSEEEMSAYWGSTIDMRAALSRVAGEHDLDASILQTLKFEDR